MRTAQLVAAKLTAWGIQIHRGLGTTGVVGTLEGKRPGQAIGLRADMDALPMQEINDLRPRLQSPARCMPAAMTATPPCCWARRSISRRSRNFAGTVHLIFQPAEEGGGGAREMIEDGLFDSFPATRCSACTTCRASRRATSRSAPGAMLASSDADVTFKGPGGHGAMPHRGADPTFVAAQFIVRRCRPSSGATWRPLEPAVVTVGPSRPARRAPQRHSRRRG